MIDVGASLGHAVEEADPKLDMVALRPMNARISATNITRSFNMRWRRWDTSLTPMTWRR